MTIELACAGPLSDDIARDIVRIPSKVLHSLEMMEHDYVRVWGSKGSCVMRAHVLLDDTERVIRIRASTREEIGVEVGDTIRIEPCKLYQHTRVKAHFAKEVDVGRGIGRLHSKVLSKLGATEGEWMEVFNLDTGGRIFLRAHKHNLPQEDAILLDRFTRRLLAIDEKRVAIESAPELGVRRSIFPVKDEGILDRIRRFIIGYKWLSLIVTMGEDTDEGKNIVRLREDNMSILGVEQNDVVDICWQDKKTKCRVLRKIAQGNSGSRGTPSSDPGLVVSLCASERRRLGTDLADIVRIRRSPSFVFRKNIDRAIVTALTTVGFYATLLLQFRLQPTLAIGMSLVLGSVFLWLLFSKVRSEV